MPAELRDASAWFAAHVDALDRQFPGVDAQHLPGLVAQVHREVRSGDQPVGAQVRNGVEQPGGPRLGARRDASRPQGFQALDDRHSTHPAARHSQRLKNPVGGTEAVRPERPAGDLGPVGPVAGGDADIGRSSGRPAGCLELNDVSRVGGEMAPQGWVGRQGPANLVLYREGDPSQILDAFHRVGAEAGGAQLLLVEGRSCPEVGPLRGQAFALDRPDLGGWQSLDRCAEFSHEPSPVFGRSGRRRAPPLRRRRARDEAPPCRGPRLPAGTGVRPHHRESRRPPGGRPGHR